MAAEIRAYFDATDRPGLRLCAGLLQDYERSLDPRLSAGEEVADAALETILANCARYAGMVLVAADGTEVVGFASVYSRVPAEEITEALREFALVGDLYVMPDHRRRGLGHALLRAAERYASQCGARWLRVSALARNAAARELYAASGFEGYEILLEKPLTD